MNELRYCPRCKQDAATTAYSRCVLCGEHVDAGRAVARRTGPEEAALRSIAVATNASYVPLGADGAGLERLYEGALAALPRASILERKERVYTERYAWFAGLALFGLLAEFLFRERRRPRRRRTAVGAAAAIALLLGAAHSAWGAGGGSA